MKVALTGTIDGLTRAAFRDRIAAAGHAYAPALDDDVDALVVGERPLASKVTKAQRLGVEVVDWAGFVERMEGAAEPERLVPSAPVASTRPTIEELPEGLRVLDVVVPHRTAVVDPSRGARVPPLEAFAHYTLDAPTLELLRFLGRAVRLRHPCLVEGATATSKTSAIQYLAARLGQPVVRLNLNGQTDATELVGRYVPAEGGWRFQEGLVPQAMRHGWWLVLDEVNLAEPAVLERINPVLERVPTLLLTEGDGTRLGPGGVPVHPAFRVFATMNPAEYQGRSVLSPAWRDRFVATWHARPPGEPEIRHLLDRVVYGRQPAVEALGQWWAAPPSVGPAPYAALADVAGMATLLARIAALHAGLMAMASAADGQVAALGAQRREPVVFTRRSLLGLLDALGELTLVDPVTGRAEGLVEAPMRLLVDALEATYVQRVADADDRARVRHLIRSLGLAAEGWVDPLVEEEPCSTP